MSILERAIAAVSPAWAHARELHRQQLGALRAYAAAGQGRLTGDWAPSRLGHNAELETSLPTMRPRVHQLTRDNAWASVALRRLPAAIVGTQVTASVQIEGKRARAQVAGDWDSFRETGNGLSDASWDADLARIVRTVCESGDCLIVWSFRPASEGRLVPLTWRALPPEYLDTVRILPSQPGRIVTSGVELTLDGTVAGYWLYDRHPADRTLALPVTSRFWPVEYVDLIHEPLWLGQRRGVPWLAPVALALDELAQYETAAIWKARMAASLALLRTRAGTAASPLGTPGKDARGRDTLSLSPGMVIDLAPGETAAQITPPPDQNFETFWRTRIMAIAAGLGLPAHAISGDLSQANYSSLREGKLLFHELVDGWQWHMVHDQVLRRAWRRFGLARFAAGRTTGGVLPPVKWSFPKRPWVDPAKDIAALRDELDLGLTTWPDAVAARGEDPEAQLEEVMRWNDRLVGAGMPVGRGRVSANGTVAAPAAGNDTTPGSAGG